MPYVNVADGIPDLIAPTVVVIAMLRGTLVGAVTGLRHGPARRAVVAGRHARACSPCSTWSSGAWCGRYCSREESSTLAAPLVLSVAAALVVQIG